jgi:teichuronic acid biosynthesis glycosyltransferase TuaG
VKSTILIPTFNQKPAYLRAAILSALYQTVPCQIIVIDDGSDEPVEPLVTELFARYQLQNPGKKTQLICHTQENRGVAGALNAGLQIATGDTIQWLSSDDLFLQSKTQLQLEEMDKTGRPVCWAGYEEGIPGRGPFWPSRPFDTAKELFDALRQHCFINACTVMWDKEVFAQVGPFDQQMVHAQDFEMLLRCAETYPFAAVERSLVRRRIHPGQMINTLRDPEEKAKKEADMAHLRERYDATGAVWVPQEETEG